ncbi:MAG: hypothetical protein ABIZ04_00625 [Opitutus sp.]
MPEANPSSAAVSPRPAAPTEFKDREAWFTVTPDPWAELTSLEYGGDRTYASTVYRMVVNALPDQRPAMEVKLLQALKHPQITVAGRQFVCRMLGLIGSSACVADVVPLLGNGRDADFARAALDSISDPAVNAAYRAALSDHKLTGSAKIGLIGSIGLRGDRQAVDALTAIAMDAKEEKDVRAASERAVEKISGEKV